MGEVWSVCIGSIMVAAAGIVLSLVLEYISRRDARRAREQELEHYNCNCYLEKEQENETAETVEKS